MKLKSIALVAVFVLSLLYGCGGESPEAVESGILSPGQVDSSMVDTVVKVRGEVLAAVENPGGLGGLIAKLGNGDGEVSIRIQPQVWGALDERGKAQFRKGKTVAVEGTLFRAGRELVVIVSRVLS